MTTRGGDPYAVLGVSSVATDAELRAAYRRRVQLHHPDHNGGSAQSARRFTEVQEAYAQIQKLRAEAPAQGQATPDPVVEARLADLERELRAARDARERARAAARQAAASATPTVDGRQARGARRPSDEELGYVTTDDSLSKILADARSELAGLFAEARERPVVQRVGDLVDEIADRFTGHKPP